MDIIIDSKLNLLKEHFQNNISPEDEKLIIEYRDKLIDILTPYIANEKERFKLALKVEKRFEEELGVS